MQLDEQLPQLAAGIAKRSGNESEGLGSRLAPPQLTIRKGPRGLNSFCVRNRDDSRTILMGSDLYPMVRAYARAAATFFLPSLKGGARPSELWSPARSSLASAIEWLAAPTPAPHEPTINVSSHQLRRSRAITDYTYRFSLCHEMSHIVLGHVDQGEMQQRTLMGEDVEVLRISQDQELAADRLGLKLQVESMPDTTHLEVALAGAVYFVHITGLLDLRLMFLTPLVDERVWRIAYTHPPALHRIFNLMASAEGLKKGLGSGLKHLHEQLCQIDGELREAANRQQDEVSAAVSKLVDDATTVCRSSSALGSSDRGGSLPKELGDAVNDSGTRVLQHLHHSPIGVLKAVEKERSSGENEGALRNLVLEHLAAILPQEFQRFRDLTPAERAAELA